MEYTFYKIHCKDENITYFYVGSTKNFTRRKNQHKSSCREESEKKNILLYKTIRENKGWDNWIMTPIHKQKVETRIDALIIEEQFRVDLKASLNVVKAYQPLERKEYLKEYMDIYNKTYYEENKEKLIEYQKNYTEENREKVSNYHKDYYEENKEKLSNYHKDYYEKNKEKLKERSKQNYAKSKEPDLLSLGKV